MNDCIFCKIASGDIPAKVAYEDDLMTAFYDLDPQAPVHVLLIPKKHISCLDDLEEVDRELIASMMLKVPEIAESCGIENGYRVVINNGENAFQTVKHLHIHILGNRKLSWPPG